MLPIFSFEMFITYFKTLLYRLCRVYKYYI